MGAIAVHHTATVDEAWDGPAAVAAMPAEAGVLHYCHAWQNSDPGDVKGNYKFPHHKTKGGPANVAACRNGLARLEGSSIPEGDKAGVKKHLQAHIDDHNKDSGNALTKRVTALASMTDAERVKAGFVRARVQNTARGQFFTVVDEDGQTPTLRIDDEIGFWGVTAADFSRAVNSITAPQFTVRINSPGGDVFDGLAILNILRSHPSAVDVVVDGLAASAASFIAMAGDTVTMMPNAMMMVHDAHSCCMGDAAAMSETADLLNLISDNIASVYASRAGGEPGDWRAVMRNEQWYTADEAVTAGLADSVAELPVRQTEAAQSGASIWNLSLFNYAGRESAPAPTPVAVEPPVSFDPETLRAALKGATL